MPAPVALTLMVGLGGVVMYAVGLVDRLPRTLPDEAIYASLARSLGTHGSFSVAGTPFPALTFGPVYPLLLAPIFRLAPTAQDAYLAARALNALVFASAAIPAWLIGRRVVREQTALIVAFAAIALPASMYTAKLQTEALAYPVVLWAVVATLRVTECASLGRQLVLLVCAAVAPLVRFELLVLGPALVAACIAAGNGRLRERFRRLMPLELGLGALLLGAAVALTISARGNPKAGMHGFDAGRLSLGGMARTVAGVAAATDLYSGIVPLAAFVILAVGVRRGESWASSTGDHLRSLVIVTIALGLGLVAVGAAYLSSIPPAFRPRVPADRYAFYIVPLLFVGFAAWLEREQPRPPGTRWIAAATAALPAGVAAVEIRGDTTIGNTNGLAFLPWIYIRAGAPLVWLLLLTAFCGLCWFLLIRLTTSNDALIKPVASMIMVAVVCAYTFIAQPAPREMATAALPPGWIDAHSTDRVVALWAAPASPDQAFALWQSTVTNRNLARVYYLTTADFFGAAFETKLQVSRGGELRDGGRRITARYVLTTRGVRIVGRAVARSGAFTLYRVRGPVQIAGGPS